MASNQHLGIWCDATGASPITGTRYTKQLRDDTYDVCEDVFKKLSAEEQAEFTAIKVPDIKLLVKNLVTNAATGSNYLEPELTTTVVAPEQPVVEAPTSSEQALAGLTPEQIEIVEAAMARKQHLGIWCDATGAAPITGTRYTKQMQGDTYDLCKSAFKKLSAEEQAEFTAIKVPDIKLLAKHILARDAGCVDAPKPAT